MVIITKKQRENGITLVALAVTIIILLILAGITITGLTGEKGLIKEAKTAKELTELAALEEQVDLAIIKAEQKHRNPTIGDVIEELKNNKVISKDDQVILETGAIHTDAGYLIEGKLDDYIGKISTGDGNNTGNNTENGNTTGNNTSGGNSTEEENTTGGGETPTPPVVNEIEPGEKVAGNNKTYTKNGTAVIPVGFAIVPGLDDVEEGLVISDVANDTQNQGNQFVWIPVTDGTSYERNRTYRSVNASTTAYDDTGYLPNGITNEEQAVRKVEGFYIARYEAGREGTTDVLASKKGVYVWNWISQEEAKSTAKTMFTNNSHVKSALISGIQWDITMAFVNGKMDGNNKIFNVTQADESRHVYLDIPVAGNNEADKVCNIYDLEGSLLEYTAEKCTLENKFIGRGSSGIIKDCACVRSATTGGTDSILSFRVVLYVV